MKELPILFSTPMVLAILKDEKSMTRRTNGLEEINENPDDWQFEWADYYLKKPWRFTQKSTVNKQSLEDRSFNQAALKCPYGWSGDILWGWTCNCGLRSLDCGVIEYLFPYGDLIHQIHMLKNLSILFQLNHLFLDNLQYPQIQQLHRTHYTDLQSQQ